MCVEYKPCRTYPFYMVTLRRLSIFHYFECNPIEKKRKEKILFFHSFRKTITHHSPKGRISRGDSATHPIYTRKIFWVVSLFYLFCFVFFLLGLFFFSNLFFFFYIFFFILTTLSKNFGAQTW